MSRRQRGRVLGALAIVLATACGNDAAKLKDVQRQADERVAQADRVAKEKIAAAEQQMEATKAQLESALAKAKSEAEDAIRDAKAGADEETKAAALAVSKARDAYKAEARAKLANLNEDTRDVAAKAAKAPAKAKVLVDKAMQEIAKEQKVIFKDIAAFDEATLETFKMTKAKLDQDLAKLKGLIASARAKVP